MIVVFFAAAAYQIISIIACCRWRFAKRYPPTVSAPGISVLKPVRGLDDNFESAIRSQVNQQYACFEILFGIQDPEDPARPVIEQLIRDFPNHSLRLVNTKTQAPNNKVGTLEDLFRDSRYPLIVVNDSDILVKPDYLSEVTAPLADQGIGLVTCLYRARATSFAGKWEAFGISTEFVPNALVAPLFGVSEFGLGSTLAFRKTDLHAAGGFAAVRDYLADDYQVGCRLHQLGKHNLISHVVVDTSLSGNSWSAIWQHQLRWARTIRVSRPLGYLGLIITYASLWAVIAALLQYWRWLEILIVCRLAAATISRWLVLKDSFRPVWLLVTPFRDLWGVAVWTFGLSGNTVKWRERELHLDREGKIC